MVQRVSLAARLMSLKSARRVILSADGSTPTALAVPGHSRPASVTYQALPGFDDPLEGVEECRVDGRRGRRRGGSAVSCVLYVWLEVGPERVLELIDQLLAEAIDVTL